MIGVFSFEDIKLWENCTYQNDQKKYQIFRKIPNYNPTSFELKPLQDNPNINKNISFRTEIATIKY